MKNQPLYVRGGKKLFFWIKKRWMERQSQPSAKVEGLPLRTGRHNGISDCDMQGAFPIVRHRNKCYKREQRHSFFSILTNCSETYRLFFLILCIFNACLKRIFFSVHYYISHVLSLHIIFIIIIINDKSHWDLELFFKQMCTKTKINTIKAHIIDANEEKHVKE